MSSAHHAPCVLATGANAPPSPHSVIVSLSTLAAVIGYETGDRAVLGAVSAGYPRFVEGALLGAVQDALARRLVSAGCGPSTSVVLVATPAAAACMLQWARARLPAAWLEEGSAAAVPGEALLGALEQGGVSPGEGDWTRAVEACGGWACGGGGDGGEALRRSDGGGWAAVLLPKGALAAARAYQQHTGCRMSTRAAELLGLRLGLWDEKDVVRHGEDGGGGAGAERAAAELLEAQVRAAFPLGKGAAPPVALSSSGMSAACALLGAVQAVATARSCARPAGAAAAWPCAAHPGGRLRDTWLQLGWLYLDTQRAFEHFAAPSCAECDRCEGAPPAARLLQVFDVHDRGAWEGALARHGSRLAGVVTEAPTNPLLTTLDLPALRAAVDAHAPGAVLVVDPTLAGLGNVNPLPHADAVVVSLTKYVGSGGDVMGGAVALNSRRELGRALAARLAPAVDAPPPPPPPREEAAWCSPFLPLAPRPPPLAGRDLLRLAACARDTARVVAGGGAACAAVAAWLRFFAPGGGGPALLRAVHTMRGTAAGAANADALGAGAGAPGSVLTLELAGTWPGGEGGRAFDAAAAAATLARFYDALPCVKGPSFGCAFTNACPFMYLVR